MIFFKELKYDDPYLSKGFNSIGMEETYDRI